MPTVTGDHENRVTDYTAVIITKHDVSGTLDASYYKGTGERGGKEREYVAEKHGRKYIVRRLTPTECARLQGFPDCFGHPDRIEDMTDADAEFWNGVKKTHAEIMDKSFKPMTKEQTIRWLNGLHTDSSEYKMWGNGIALPCAEFVLSGIAEALREEDGT